MTEWPSHLQDVPFDHDAAFRAGWAVDEALARLDRAAEHRWNLVREHLRCWNEGPFVDHLESEVGASASEANWLAERLRIVRSRLEGAREQALADQIRLEVARSDWLVSEQEQAASLSSNNRP